MRTYVLGRCDCGGNYHRRLEALHPPHRTDQIEAEQGRCADCGSWVYRADTLGRLERAIATTSDPTA